MQWLKKIQGWVLRIPLMRFIAAVAKRFGQDNGAIYAGALSFFMLLAFVPMVLTGVAILAHSVSNAHQADIRVDDIVHSLLPSGAASNEATLLLQRLDLQAVTTGLVEKRGTAGILGFLSLLWAAMQIFVNASAAMNSAWEVKETRNWFLVRGIALALMAASGVLVTFTVLLSGAPSAVAKFNLPLVHHLPIPLWALTIIFEALAVVVNAGLYLLIYKFLPNAAVPWKAALVGGFVASIAWEVAKKGLATWLLRANHTIYGDLAGLILFILWIYYSMMILILGAEVAVVYSKQRMPAAAAQAKSGREAEDKAAKHADSPAPARRERPRRQASARR